MKVNPYTQPIHQGDKKLPVRKDVTPSVLRKSVFDTKNYWFYYTEVLKERN
jgi:hypothetical protein